MMNGTEHESILMALVLRNRITLGKLILSKFDVNPLLTNESRRYHPDYDFSSRYQVSSQESSGQVEEDLRGRETIDLFRNAVDTAREGLQQSLAGSERVVEAVGTNLSVNLSHQNIEKIPEAVVDILKPGVQMYESTHTLVFWIHGLIDAFCSLRLYGLTT